MLGLDKEQRKLKPLAKGLVEVLFQFHETEYKLRNPDETEYILRNPENFMSTRLKSLEEEEEEWKILMWDEKCEKGKKKEIGG